MAQTHTLAQLEDSNERNAGYALALAQNDYTKATESEKAAALAVRCNLLGVDVRSAPFSFIVTKGKTIMYPNLSLMETLAKKNELSVIETFEGFDDKSNIFTMKGYVQGPDGRRITDRADLYIPPSITPEERANAAMKCSSKLFRRLVKKWCGLSALPDADWEPVGNQTHELRREMFAIMRDLGWPHDRELRHRFYFDTLGYQIDDGASLDEDTMSRLVVALKRIQMGEIESPAYMGQASLPSRTIEREQPMRITDPDDPFADDKPTSQYSTASSSITIPQRNEIKQLCEAHGVGAAFVKPLVEGVTGTSYELVAKMSEHHAADVIKYLLGAVPDDVARLLAGKEGAA